ncbi:PepSY domain-containing protein [Streptomyces sp. NBC_00203]|uniref:PepSY domain-containing protein n=1 Tax=Streptomyces sp. NBC_00203 TaxID=2975680 RepID=UPI00324CCB7C
MSQPVPPDQPEPKPAAKPFRQRLPRLPQLRRSRKVALGVAVVLLGGAAVGAVAIADHDHGDKNDRGRIAADRDQRGGGNGGHRGRGEGRGEDAGKNDGSKANRNNKNSDNGQSSDNSQSNGENSDNSQNSQNGQSTLAPAPLPAVSAAKAIEAAGKAVPGGKPDALRVVTQQGGGSAWEVEVLGTDGVRHLVTLDGATGAVTGNTVASTTPAA